MASRLELPLLPEAVDAAARTRDYPVVTIPGPTAVAAAAQVTVRRFDKLRAVAVESLFDRRREGAPGVLAVQRRPPGCVCGVGRSHLHVDDPVKRVDNMTMAWGLEARVPFLDHELVELAATCPPELHLADHGKGVLKAVGRRVIPSEVIDRPKGYFPVPALKFLQGPYLELVRDALTSPAAKERGLFKPAYVDRLLDKAEQGEAELTPLRGNKLWQLGLLELWLQAHDL